MEIRGLIINKLDSCLQSIDHIFECDEIEFVMFSKFILEMIRCHEKEEMRSSSGCILT